MNKEIAIMIGLALPLSLRAAQTLEWSYRTDGPEVHQAFGEAHAALQSASAVVKDGRQEIAYGTVVSADGFILTKASEIAEREELSVMVGRETYDDVKVMATDETWDLALLKVGATGLAPARLVADEVLQGSWLVANGATTRRERRVQVGIAAARTREIFPKGGVVLGLTLEEEKGGLKVTDVVAEGGAERAGIEKGDRLLKVGEVEVATLEGLVEQLKERQAGDEVRVEIERGGQRQELLVEATARTEMFGEEMDRNDAMSGEFSPRRTGFPRVMQHDIMGSRWTMGGPVLNLSGECVGMNIARFSRCETYAIPAADLKRLAEEMIARTRS